MSDVKPFRAVVFGKTGCDKCKILRRRVEAAAAHESGDSLDFAYVDIETEEGLVVFCRAESLNPQRIPALLLEAYDGKTCRYRPIPRPRGEADGNDTVRLPRILGLQTDYSDRGRGVIPPGAIREEIACALASRDAAEPA